MTTMDALPDAAQSRRSARLGLVLGALAVLVFVGYMALVWLSRR